jgi:predicted transcriptional regulator
MMVEEDNEKEDLLRTLSNYFTRKILFTTVSHAMSVGEISRETAIPISTCYRAIRALLKLRLLKSHRVTIRDTGKKCVVFVSTIRAVKLNISPDKTSIEVSPVSDEISWPFDDFTESGPAQVVSYDKNPA